MKSVKKITIGIVVFAAAGSFLVAGCSGAAARSGSQAASGQYSAQGSAGGSRGMQGTGQNGGQAQPGQYGNRQGNGQTGAGQYGGGQNGGGQYGGGGSRRQVSIPVQVTTIPNGTLLADRDTAGVLSPVLQSSVAAPVSGIVAKVLRNAGDWVGDGTIVVQLDDSPLKIALANAQAAVDTAKINLDTAQNTATDSLPRLQLQVDSAQSSVNSAQKTYDSQKALYDLGGISASALDQAAGQLATAKANLESAKLALDQGQKGIASTPSQNVDALKVALVSAQNNLAQAQYNLDHASIKAPFEGQIATMNANPGMYLGQNSAAFVLVSSAKQVSFGIAPSDAAAMKPGMRMSWENGGTSHPIILKQSPSNPVNGIVPLTASLLKPVSLPFGTIGNVSYLIELGRGAIVPLTSVETLENQNFIFVVNNGRVETVNIAVVAESGTMAVASGATPGMEVVLSPPPGLVAGAQVQVIQTPFPQSTSIRLDGGASPGASTLGVPRASFGQQGSSSTTAPSSGQWSGQRSGSGQGGQWSGRRQGATTTPGAGGGSVATPGATTTTTTTSGSGS